MVTSSIIANPDQRTLDLLEVSSPQKKRIRKDPADKQRRLLARKLYEVMHGQRPAVKVYSTKLQTHFWLVNEGLANPEDEKFGGNVISMEKLAKIYAEEKLAAAVKKILI